MKKFLVRTLFFLLPVLGLAFAFEFLLRRIPNDYQIKHEYLEQKSGEIEILSLGSSHAYYGIDPVWFSAPAYNAAYISQTIDIDYKLLKKYEGRLDKVKVILLPVSAFSLASVLENGPEHWRVKNYKIYSGIPMSITVTGSSEILSGQFRKNFQKMKLWYLNDSAFITTSDLGFGLNYHSSKTKGLESGGKEAASRHNYVNEDVAKENARLLHEIAVIAKSRNAKLILYTPPAHVSYRNAVDPVRLTEITAVAESVKQQNPNVIYLNFLDSPRFGDEDFFDADHLNEKGARKFTEMLDSVIKANK